MLNFKQTIDTGLTEKVDKQNRFLLKRFKTGLGLERYRLENTARGEQIEIPRSQFDRFRSSLAQVYQLLQDKESPASDIDQRIFWGELEIYRFSSRAPSQPDILIRDLRQQSLIHCSREAVLTLLTLLYSDEAQHPSDVFDHIIAYHKLFQFTFREGSGSINSALLLQKDVMCEVREYQPSLNAKTVKRLFPSEEAPPEGDLKGLAPAPEGTEAKSANFKSKLGQRDSDLDYAVDYDALFKGARGDKRDKDGDVSPSKRAVKRHSDVSFSLPLFAHDIKLFQAQSLKCEFHSDEAEAFRDTFLRDRHAELYVGIEIMDAIFRDRGRLQSFRFPLYYMRVRVEEAGRSLHLSLDPKGELFLNHLALAQLVERFSPLEEGQAAEVFFTHLLAQKIELEKRLNPVRLMRQLPYQEEVFLQTRDLLIGSPGENGKGGLLQSLKLIGVECDLEAVILYKAVRQSSVLQKALDRDLEAMQALASEAPSRFYQTLIGKCLVPERQAWHESKSEAAYHFILQPGQVPRAQRRLMRHLDKHDLLLLEGPPGTGKTHSIMNLLIHCVNTQKRLLIVSDQEAAIHALIEKLEEYLLGRDRTSPEAINTLALWRAAVKVVDQVPTAETDLRAWVSLLSQMLALDNQRERDWPLDDPERLQRIQKIDQEMHTCRETMRTLLETRFGRAKGPRQVSPKYAQATTAQEIQDLRRFLDFLGAGHHGRIRPEVEHQAAQEMLAAFVASRKSMRSGILKDCYEDFSLESAPLEKLIEDTTHHLSIVDTLIQKKPRKLEEFRTAFRGDERSRQASFLLKHWQEEYSESKQAQIIHRMSSLLIHACLKTWQELAQYLRQHLACLKLLAAEKDPAALIRQFQAIHKALSHPSALTEMPLALEIADLMRETAQHKMPPVHSLLLRLDSLQSERDELIQQHFLCQLAAITKSVIATQKTGTNAATALHHLLESLKDSKSVDYGAGFTLLQELQEKLLASFPIWICRKQAVSFLFPSRDKIFDLVIVDEAGQCKVDDALPLLYRAKKILAVGDEHQTVLDKRSPVDDYLFAEFELEEMLRSSQARGIKGGGSHLFSLMKSVKQGGVMLDEHYRCPPDIIRYSNDYVYQQQLKIMQWQAPESAPSVVVDYSEKDQKPSRKPPSGKFKGLETDMIDRFFDFVGDSILSIEKETGEPVQLETDVALCYFLLKNEVYFKEMKTKFLQKMKRGRDILDGAGAALQGKERKYVFYFWDINKTNIAFFRQGDDPDKRRGELNVLMSRPKVRAYHFLHHGFDELKHNHTTITDYLWRSYLDQKENKKPEAWQPRTLRPDKSYRPWQRASGPTILAILSEVLQQRGAAVKLSEMQTQMSVKVGDPRQKVDLVLWPSTSEQLPLALIDLSSFESSEDPARSIIDYFFQLKRAVPGMEPIFFFMHEITDDRFETYLAIEAALEARHKPSPRQARGPRR